MTGRVSDGVAKGIYLYVNGQQQLLDVWGTIFEGEIALRPGMNQIRTVAMGTQGPLAEHVVEVQYVPPEPSPEIRIVRPADGTVFDPSGHEVVTVEGVVTRPLGSTATVVFNDFSLPVTIRDGRFSATIPRMDPVMRIWAEICGEGGLRRSVPITLRDQPPNPSRGYVLLHLPTPSMKVDARVWLSHRTTPGQIDGPRKVTVLHPSEGPATGQPSMLFVFRPAQPGAYALALDYRFPPGDSVDRGWGLIFVPGPHGYRVLRLGPFRLSGKGRATLAKFLLPQGVFWDEDFWFSGISESAESLTKFRYADRVSWTEHKGEGEFSAPK